MTDTIDAEKSYLKFLPAAQSLAAAAVKPYRLDADLAVVNAHTALAAILPFKTQIPQHLPKVDTQAILGIAELAVAVKFAALRAEQAAPTEKGIAEALKKARALRRALLSVAKGLAETGQLSHEEVEAIVRGTGNRDIAEDNVALADLFRKHEAKIAGKHPVTKEQIDEAATTGSWLLANMRTESSPTEKAGPKPAEVDTRDRLGTLLWNAHADLRKVAHYFYGETFDDLAPPLQSRNGKRGKKDEPATN